MDHVHAGPTRLVADDVDHALRMTGQEPLYGFQATEHIPFRFASGGGRDLHFTEDRELDLAELVAAAVPKIPVSPAIRAHWLAIDGVQPSIPENPPPQSKDQLVADRSPRISLIISTWICVRDVVKYFHAVWTRRRS